MTQHASGRFHGRQYLVPGGSGFDVLGVVCPRELQTGGYEIAIEITPPVVKYILKYLGHPVRAFSTFNEKNNTFFLAVENCKEVHYALTLDRIIWVNHLPLPA